MLIIQSFEKPLHVILHNLRHLFQVQQSIFQKLQLLLDLRKIHPYTYLLHEDFLLFFIKNKTVKLSKDQREKSSNV